MARRVEWQWIVLAAALIASGPAFFLTVYLLLDAWLAGVARADPIPNQNAMVIAFLAGLASLFIGLIVTTIGLAIAIRVGWRAMRSENHGQGGEGEMRGN